MELLKIATWWRYRLGRGEPSGRQRSRREKAISQFLPRLLPEASTRSGGDAQRWAHPGREAIFAGFARKSPVAPGGVSHDISRAVP